MRPLLAWRARLAAGLEIFLLGLAKKLVLADGLARFADPGFAAAARHDPLTLIEAWVALLAYALQIYFDFSGYSDMAIGLARLFGFNGTAIPSIYVKMLPVLGAIGRAVPVLPYLGDARSLSLPQAALFLALGWFIALALPALQRMSTPGRSAALVASFALSLQALFFVPYTVPFCIFSFNPCAVFMPPARFRSLSTFSSLPLCSTAHYRSVFCALKSPKKRPDSPNCRPQNWSSWPVRMGRTRIPAW